MAALQLFVRKGYVATKISDIAEAVGMSSGLMFHYFESKEKLYEELIELGLSGPQGVFDHTFESAIAFFEGTAERIFAVLEEEPPVASMFTLMAQATNNDAAPETVKGLLAGFDVYEPTIELIKQGQRDGTIREGDPRALSIAYWCSIQGIAEQLAADPTLPYPNADWIVDIIRKR